jgi:preprotein translocase subunit SecG
MLYYLVAVLYVLVCVSLIGVILLQQGKGGDIANAFGGGGSQAVFGARAGATLLTRATSVLAGLFVVLSLILTAWGQRGSGSVVGGIDAPAPAAPVAPVTTPTPAPSQPAGTPSQPSTPTVNTGTAPATPPAGGTPPPPPKQ